MSILVLIAYVWVICPFNFYSHLWSTLLDLNKNYRDSEDELNYTFLLLNQAESKSNRSVWF